MLPNARGFSLVEIMIAVAIIGIMATAAIPLVRSSFERSKINRTQQDLNNIRIKVLQAVSDGRNIPTTIATSQTIDLIKDTWLSGYDPPTKNGWGGGYELRIQNSQVSIGCFPTCRDTLNDQDLVYTFGL